MMRKLGSVQHNMCSCSVTAAGNLLLVGTSNGVDESHDTIPAPEAPSFIALDKRGGELIWADDSPGKNILHGQWSSPAAGTFEGRYPGDLRRRRRLALQLPGRADRLEVAQAALEVRLQPQGVEVGGRRPGRAEQHHRHARGARGPGVHLHRPGSRARRGARAPLVRRPDQARRRQPENWSSTARVSPSRRVGCKPSTKKPASGSC